MGGDPPPGGTGHSALIEEADTCAVRGRALAVRLQRALTLLAGECKTQKEACATAGMTQRALQKALKRPSVRAYMREEILASLGVSASRAARRLHELIDQGDNAMASYHASKFALAVGAGVSPRDERPPLNVNVGVSVGYVIDTSRRRRPIDPDVVDRSEVSPVGGVVRSRPLPVVIEGEGSAVEVPGE
jgi:hypothetical protein